jgi:hypothetical protein
MTPFTDKALRTYQLYGIAVMFTTLIYDLEIWISNTVIGARTGVYSFYIDTNSIGEDHIELVILLTALPAALAVFWKVFFGLLKKKF